MTIQDGRDVSRIRSLCLRLALLLLLASRVGALRVDDRRHLLWISWNERPGDQTLTSSEEPKYQMAMPETAERLLGSYKDACISPERLGFVETADGALIPAVLVSALPNEAGKSEKEIKSRFEVVKFEHWTFFVLRIWFSDTEEVKLVFDPKMCFGWLVLLARSTKLALHHTARPTETQVQTVDTQEFRLWLAAECLLRATLAGTLDRTLATFPVLLKALGIPLRKELNATTPDLVKDFVQCSKATIADPQSNDTALQKIIAGLDELFPLVSVARTGG